MQFQKLTKTECEKIHVGEAISLTAVMAIAAIAVMAVIVYRLYVSSKGNATIPGGWKFSWVE